MIGGSQKAKRKQKGDGSLLNSKFTKIKIIEESAELLKWN